MHVHALRGCAPVPLAHYLKALGILRLVAEQRDASARGWWRDECFHLATTLDREQLVAFFLDAYEPSPITAPWNKGSGFVIASDPGLGPMEAAAAPRYARLRHGIEEARALVAELADADAAVRVIKAETKRKGLTAAQKQKLRADPEVKKRLGEAEKLFARRKANLIPRCRLAWRGTQRQWMDAAIVLADADKPTFPALLGTGGNDGRLDFTNNLYQRLAELFDPRDGSPCPGVAARFDAALWGSPEKGVTSGVAAGQYLPGAAGGANSANGPSGDSAVNPVDFVLMLEGALLFTGHATRRLDVDGRMQAGVPFAVRSGATGYGSASSSDEGPRGEQWMPLWECPANLAEVRHLLSEGRARLGSGNAREPLEFARAVTRLGIARGITAFERFGYIERNGQSNLAVPLGRFRVPAVPPKLVGLLDQLDAWLSRLRRQARDDHAPARLRMVERRLSDALFSVVGHSDEPQRWQQVLLALAEVEGVMVSGSGFRAGPVPRLDPRWWAAANDGSPEVRLALAFARQGVVTSKKRWDGIRRHWLPLDGERPRFATTGDAGSPRIAQKCDVVIRGRDGVADSIALVERRLIEGSQRAERHLPLSSSPGTHSALSDLARLVAGSVNLDRTLALGRAFMALDARRWPTDVATTPGLSADDTWPDDAWLAIRLAALPWPLAHGRDIKGDPAILRRLATGDPAGAFEIARRRLLGAGIACHFRIAIIDPARARLWAAALAFPISLGTARAMARRLDATSTPQGISA